MKAATRGRRLYSSATDERTDIQHKTAVAVLQVQETEDLTYKEVMKIIRDSIDPEKDLKIKEIQIRKTVSGRKILTIENEEANCKAGLAYRTNEENYGAIWRFGALGLSPDFQVLQ